jgi:hypothetical protein
MAMKLQFSTARGCRQKASFISQIDPSIPNGNPSSNLWALP